MRGEQNFVNMRQHFGGQFPFGQILMCDAFSSDVQITLSRLLHAIASQ